MLNVTKMLFAATLALGATACAASANTGTRYVEKRISQGPRPAQYVLVHAKPQAERPYALTGERERARAARPAVQPSHPKGTHDAY